MDFVLGLMSACVLLGLLPSCDEDALRGFWGQVASNKSFRFVLGGGHNSVVIIGLAFCRAN